MSAERSLIAPTSKPLLESALKDKLQRRAESTGSLGELEPLAIRLGLMQNTLKPSLEDPQLMVFAADHGLAVDGIVGPQTARALGLVAEKTSKAKAPSKLLARIAECESGGDPTAVSADGRYRGKYQFSRSTWRAMGGKGDPAKAPESEQDKRAAALLEQAGTSPWPVCGNG